MTFFEDLIVAFKNEMETFDSLFDNVSFDNKSLSDFHKNISQLRNNSFNLLVYKLSKIVELTSEIMYSSIEKDTKFRLMASVIVFAIEHMKLQDKSALCLNSYSFSIQVIKLLKIGIDEEWQGVIGEQKYEWGKSGLTKEEISNKLIISLLSLHYGRFKSWLQLLKILSWIKLIYK